MTYYLHFILNIPQETWRTDVSYPQLEGSIAEHSADNPLTVNQARAMRVAEIINDYRTLLLHISQQRMEVCQADHNEEGYVVLRESLASAQNLSSVNYQPCPVTGQGNVETEKAELQRYTDLHTSTSVPIVPD